ncbi:MAG: hypothetical protein JOZ13_05170 [Alphaproteobacteria bacterium]|nr:hypothetical protein [Alphaproteobacteria bacterium]
MSTVCLIGNSHVANLKRALPAVQAQFPQLQTIFFASEGTSMELDIVDGGLVGRTEPARARMAMTSGGDGAIRPVYDAYVLCGLTLSSIRAIKTYYATMKELRAAGRAHAASVLDIAEGMAPAIVGSLAFDIAAKLRRLTVAPIFVIATPLSAYERHPEMWARFEAKDAVGLLAEAYHRACEKAAKDIDAVFVPQPAQTIGPNPLTTKPQFYTLTPEETAAERAQHAHMNPEFGAIVLRDVLGRVVAALDARAGRREPTAM